MRTNRQLGQLFDTAIYTKNATDLTPYPYPYLNKLRASVIKREDKNIYILELTDLSGSRMRYKYKELTEKEVSRLLSIEWVNHTNDSYGEALLSTALDIMGEPQ